jgi:dihydrofolate synthase / folylpolyglutamate synthase
MKIRAIKTRIFRPGEDLLAFLERYFGRSGARIATGDILVVTSKIIALSENRVCPKTTEAAKRRLVQRESEFQLATKYVYLTIRDGIVMANAGVDESNANGAIILLPRDSFRAARLIRAHFRRQFGLKHLGVIITDSRCLPLRAGITGVALGYAGFKGLKDYRRRRDIFGRPFHYSRVDMADSLATAAVLVMGEGAERQPLAVISGAPVEYSNRVNKNELKIDIKEDIYGPLFRKIR